MLRIALPVLCGKGKKYSSAHYLQFNHVDFLLSRGEGAGAGDGELGGF